MKREFMRIISILGRLMSFKRCSLLRTLLCILLLSVVSSFFFLYRVMDSRIRVPKANPPIPNYKCIRDADVTDPELQLPHKHRDNSRSRFNHRALVITESSSSTNGQHIRNFLSSLRIESKLEVKTKTLPALSSKRAGRFAVIIFENYNSYLQLDNWNKQLLDKYCHDYEVSIIGFVHQTDPDSLSFGQAEGYHLTFQYKLELEDYKLNADSELWRVVKPGEIWTGFLPNDWTVFHYNHSAYQPLAFTRLSSKFLEFRTDEETDLSFKYVPAVYDNGDIDGISRVLFGSDLDFWLHRVIFMDALSFVSSGKLELKLDRYIQVDIDDIFVGKEGIRMKAPDVDALIASQERLREAIEGFRFNLGFSGGYFLYGSPEEDAGDRKLIENSNKFRWFSHMFRHEQAHKYDQAFIEKSMRLNKQFAETNGLEVYNQYAIAPHHSGVYPVYEPLYASWRSVWGVKITSTEEYPKLLPSYKRRGFIHRGIMVMPRQTCGLFTTTLFASDFKGGLANLDKSIQGGELFQTILTTPISVFMTHLSNYGNDRLALYELESVTTFINCWTNLRLLSLPPLELGLKYFEMFPQDKDPIWTNPCEYNRHLAIWPVNRTCSKLPNFLVVGPQKTGTTALYSFLSQHPSLLTNHESSKSFEEIQFFNSNNYHFGLNWYMDFFPSVQNMNGTLLFEKSANYFDSDLAPKRISALLPKAKIIVILMNPAERAYSWYQHMRYHNDPTALNHSFYEVISTTDMAPAELRSLRNRCLTPGLYAQHLLKWLDHYSSRQIHIIHSEKLREDPVSVMHSLQRFIGVEPFIDYSNLLRFDSRKGFFCQVLPDDRMNCLGKSKGHKHPPMSLEAENHLRIFYRKHNINLSKLLPTFKTEIPSWLKLELEEVDIKT